MKFSHFLQSGASEEDHFMLVGHPVSHSLSPVMHNTAAEHYGMSVRYIAVDVQPGELGRLAAHFNSDQFLGANVTIPYKKELTSFLDETDEIVEATGALNTIARKNGRLSGYNTDVWGFLYPLKEHEQEIEGSRAIVFGTGGAAAAIIFALGRAGVDEIILVSRNPGRSDDFNGMHPQIHVESYEAWHAFAGEAFLLVNATPLGMDPNKDQSPVKEQERSLLKDKICYDIVYNPVKTKFMSQAEQAGSRKVIGGLEMLIQQGNRSFQIWTGRPFPVDKIRRKLYEEIS